MSSALSTRISTSSPLVHRPPACLTRPIRTGNPVGLAGHSLLTSRSLGNSSIADGRSAVRYVESAPQDQIDAFAVVGCSQGHLVEMENAKS
jgi:hypothetical protein